MNTRKLVLLFVILVLLYICFVVAIRTLNHGHYVDYTLKDKDTNQKFMIEETRTTRVKGEKNNYYFEIHTDNITFNFQDEQDFKKRNYVIKEIKYFKDDKYECIYPIFKNIQLKRDMICKKDGIQYEYSSLQHNDKKLLEFEKKLSAYGYQKKVYQKKSKVEKEYKELTYYPENIDTHHIIAVDSYKGIYIVTKDNIKEVNLFQNDEYEKTLKIVIDKYYVIANYDEKYEFNKFILVNLVNGKRSEITLNKPISFDSYIQGMYKDSFYLLDTDHQIQYEINVKSKKVKEIGNEKKGIMILENGQFQNDKTNKYINNRLYFTDDYSDIFGKKYERVYKQGKKLSGYYYLYQKSDDGYLVYRANIQNTDLLTYLFTTDDINSVSYIDNVIYYRYHNVMYQYHYYNKVPILKDSEFEFNHTLNVGAYRK